MAVVIRDVVGEGAQRESVVVQILRIADQGADEIGSADVVSEVAEKLAAERVVAHVLNHGAAIGVTVRRLQLFGGGVGKSRKKKRFDRVVPGGVNERFVRENPVGIAVCRK